MPKQSRGFWICSFCSQAFDLFEEASQHETEDCLRRPQGDTLDWQRQQQHQPQRRQDTYSMPPLESATTVSRLVHRRDSPSVTYSYERKPEVRYIPLLGTNTPSSLIEGDSIACRSIELFEINEQNIRGAFPGQLGLRCSFCTAQNSFIFPKNRMHVGDCVRQMAEQHLTACPSFPNSAREVLIRALRQRQQSKKVGGPAWHEEERNHKSLIKFCSVLCQQARVIDKSPLNSGIMFEDSEQHSSESLAQIQPLPISRAVPISSPVARHPSPQPDESFREASMYNNRAIRNPFNTSPYDARAQFDEGQSRQQITQSYEQAPDQTSFQYQPYMSSYNIPPDYPFIQERGGEWICKFCSHLHISVREPTYCWFAADRSPPPSEFIDQHLSACRGFQENQYHGFDYPAPSTNVQTNTPLSSYNNARWDIPFDDENNARAVAGESRQPTQQYAVASSESARYDAAPYRQLQASIPPHGYSIESPQSQRYRSPALPPTQAHLPESNAEYNRGLEYLAANDRSIYDDNGDLIPESSTLVLGEDRLLLTDYFYYVMKQLRKVQFTEADRRTRGGKRENIEVGYGGLQCVHCADLPNTRKFYWSNVDRLANSFAEIPSHVLKCRRCPQPTKDALLLLKQRHPEQMARLPRGSQKVFFRRMWRRLHDEDPPSLEDRNSPHADSPSLKPAATELASQPQRPQPVDTRLSFLEYSPAGTNGSDESILMLQRSTEEAAKALLDASMQANPPSPMSRVLLAVPDDHKWLSDTDCFIRRQLEVFCSTIEDVENARNDHKFPVQEGQVGIRCIHCALSRNGARGQAVSYPYNINGIYEAAREFQRLHLESCENLPLNVKSKLGKLKGSASLSSVLRKYYVIAANAIGLKDSNQGIRACGESIPIGSQAALTFSEESSPNLNPVKTEDVSPKVSPTESFQASRKRAPSEVESYENQSAKRSTFGAPEDDNLY